MLKKYAILIAMFAGAYLVMRNIENKFAPVAKLANFGA